MAYPATSDFTSSALHASWFVDRSTGEQACQSDAWNILRDVQEEVRERIELAGGQVSTYDRGLVLVQDVLVEPSYGWDRALLRGLWGVAALDRAPSDYLDAVRAAADGGPVTPLAMSTALWVTYTGKRVTNTGNFVYGRGSPADAAMPVGVVLPNHGFAPPMPTRSQASSAVDCRAIPAGTLSPPTLPPGGGRMPFSPLAAIAVLALAAAGLAALAQGTKIETKRRK